jgi:hypothetical protein
MDLNTVSTNKRLGLVQEIDPGLLAIKKPSNLEQEKGGHLTIYWMILS